jgi:hypothetical protein
VDGGGRALLARFALAGAAVWSRADKGAGGASVGRWELTRLAPLADGGLLAAGAELAPGGAAASHALVVRYSAAGALLWSRRDAQAGYASSQDVVAVPGAGGLLTVFAVGGRASVLGGPQQPLLLRLDGAGNLTQSAALLGGAALAAAGLAERRLDAIALAGDGALLIASRGRAKAGAGDFALGLHHVSAGGQQRWDTLLSAAEAGPVCAGCLALAALDGAHAVASRLPSAGAAASAAVPLSLRVGAYGHASCAAAGVCGHRDLAACADGLPCTHDGCDAGAGCTLVADDALCADGNVCTSAACDAGKGCVVTELQAPCKLNSSCELAACAFGKCKPTGALIDCDDGKPCTIDSCDSLNGCKHVAQLSGSICFELGACKQGKCSGTTCASLVAMNCDDGQACTVDACLPGKGCTHTTKDGEPCSDGDACTEGDLCAQGACKGSAKACGSGKYCYLGGCQAQTCGGSDKALTWIVGWQNKTWNTLSVGCNYTPQGFAHDCNPYTGDAPCGMDLPLFCLRKDGSQPPYSMNAWLSGTVRLGPVVRGCALKTQAAGAAICAQRFGAGWKWLAWHDGPDKWPTAYGDIAPGTRGWVHIADQAAGNCGK